MASASWDRRIRQFGSVEAARAYCREKARKSLQERIERLGLDAVRALQGEANRKSYQKRIARIGNVEAVLKKRMVDAAVSRARKKGVEATITVADIYWPTHCPVLGVPLDYSTPFGRRRVVGPAAPSLDRWDTADGYVPGNVFVISMRANRLKGNATPDELEAVANYARNSIW